MKHISASSLPYRRAKAHCEVTSFHVQRRRREIMAGHTNLSRIAKVDNAAIAAVREGRYITDAKLEALRQFAAKVTRQRGVVSQADVAAFKAAGYDNRAMLDVLVLAATKLISNYTNHLAQTPLDAFMNGAEWNAPGKLKPAA
jgi:alkylhydroperoxidase family enzyme